jgi:hypothetical protein
MRAYRYSTLRLYTTADPCANTCVCEHAHAERGARAASGTRLDEQRRLRKVDGRSAAIERDSDGLEIIQVLLKVLRHVNVPVGREVPAFARDVEHAQTARQRLRGEVARGGRAARGTHRMGCSSALNLLALSSDAMQERRRPSTTFQPGGSSRIEINKALSGSECLFLFFFLYCWLSGRKWCEPLRPFESRTCTWPLCA